MYDARTRLAEQVVAEVRKHFGDRVCRNVVPRTVRLSEAPSFGQPIIVFDSSSRGAHRLPGAGQGGQWWRAAADWVGASAPSSRTRSSSDRSSALLDIPIASIRPNPQPAAHATSTRSRSASLTASIRELGVLQPVLVRPRPKTGSYELIAGERRWRAAKRAGLQTIPALVRTATDQRSLEQALVENLHRQDLNPLEEAAAYQQLIEDFGLTHEELADRVGKSRAAITNTLRLFQLPPAIQRLVIDGALSAGHARALLGTPDRAFQESLARRAVAEQLSVRSVEEAVGPERVGRVVRAGRPG